MDWLNDMPNWALALLGGALPFAVSLIAIWRALFGPERNRTEVDQ